MARLRKRESPMGKFKTIRVTSIIEILKELKKDSNLILFRGQSNSRWPLEPKIARLYKKRPPAYSWDRIEYSILGDFKQFGIAFTSKEPKHDLDWLMMGQHYGLPTRLLDWTTNPLKATFWALNSTKNKRDGALFAISPRNWISRTSGEYDFNTLRNVIPVFPNMIDARIIAQEACFIIFPFPKDDTNVKPLENIKVHGDSYFVLLKMVIPFEYHMNILRELSILGVNARTLFPDLTGLSEFIQLKWTKEFSS